MNTPEFDHTAIAVDDLDEAIPRYERLLGVRCGAPTNVPDQGVRVAFLPMGSTSLELIQPTDQGGGVARFLGANGEGLHHIGIRVHDIRAELGRLSSEGVELVDSEPRRGVHGLIAFVHPRATGGVLVELVEGDSGHTSY
jgi:methylmalonyl-CoA/ethylmalonyl-CoA epimerase